MHAIAAVVAIVCLTLGGFIAGLNCYVPPKIANTEVPSGLQCAEDDTIWWIGINTLGCRHWEDVPNGPIWANN